MKIPGAVLAEYERVMEFSVLGTYQEEALEAALEQLRGELEADAALEAMRAETGWEEWAPDESNIYDDRPFKSQFRRELKAALNSVLGEAEHQGGEQ